MNTKEKLIKDCIIAVCVDGEDLKKYKSELDAEGVYEKCNEFVATFQNIQKSGQPSNVALNKLKFKGKQIGLTEKTLQLLEDVLEGKHVPSTSGSEDISSQNSLQDNVPEKDVVLGGEAPIDKTKNIDEVSRGKHVMPVNMKLNQVLKGMDMKKFWTKASGYLRAKRKWGVGIAAVVVALIVALSLPPFGSDSEKENVLSKEEQLKHVLESQLKLEMVEYTFKNVYRTPKDDNFWGSRRLLIQYTAYVTAGVDLRKLSMNDVTVSEDRNTITIRLPKAEIINCSIPDESIHPIKTVTGFRSEINTAEINHVLGIVENEIEKKAIPNCGILQNAEDFAKAYFELLLGQLGYQNVNVLFKN